MKESVRQWESKFKRTKKINQSKATKTKNFQLNYTTIFLSIRYVHTCFCGVFCCWNDIYWLDDKIIDNDGSVEVESGGGGGLKLVSIFCLT